VQTAKTFQRSAKLHQLNCHRLACVPIAKFVRFILFRHPRISYQTVAPNKPRRVSHHAIIAKWEVIIDKLSHDFESQDLQRFLFSILLTCIRGGLSATTGPTVSSSNSIGSLGLRPKKLSYQRETARRFSEKQNSNVRLFLLFTIP